MCAQKIVNIFYVCMYTYTHIHIRFRTVMKLNSVTQLNNISCNTNIGIKIWTSFIILCPVCYCFTLNCPLLAIVA